MYKTHIRMKDNNAKTRKRTCSTKVLTTTRLCTEITYIFYGPLIHYLKKVISKEKILNLRARFIMS